ncbi:MAG: VOC family protein [Ardenticatenaceae bacterium]|nr:VOC family protein [Ardenticatenaceae bacterium]
MTTLPRIQHVSIHRPFGEEATQAARAFYGGSVGLPEIAVPETLQGRGLIWYQLGNTELHIFIETFAGGGQEHHFCVAVADVEAMRARLEADGHTTRDTTPIPGRPRFFCRDPFGNLVEFTTIL